MVSRGNTSRADGGRKLVVVESPAKARTIANILGKRFEVKASVGHVRDLPKSALGVDVERDFAPKYLIPKDKRKAVKEIQQAASKAESVYLATDPDREGEAIAWHLLVAAGLGDRPHYRVVFHSITASDVEEAFRSPREIDMRLVEAQQARRVVDRLVGYGLSPFLWKKVRRGLSAGRVQSAALGLITKREDEISRFTAQEYWSIEVALAKEAGVGESEQFRAKLHSRLGAEGEQLSINSAEEAAELSAALQRSEYRVVAVRKKKQVRRPPPPFITSTLQQDSFRRFGFSAKRTMALSQQLYEGLSLGSGGEVGLITYMRTDSTQVAASAQQEAKLFLEGRFGKEYVPPSPRRYSKKVRMAQEAHEAIRPTSVRRDPQSLRASLGSDQYKLYSLIWERYLVSQMADAVYDVTTVDIEASGDDAESYLLRATNTEVRFTGFLELSSREEDDKKEKVARLLPSLQKDEFLQLLDLYPEQHFTEPPARYSEGTLVRALEEKGVGRPSTYAPILGTIQERGYVEKVGRALRPTDLGMVVDGLLAKHFPRMTDIGFTAEMEENLDEIARGGRPWQPVVREFYEPLEKALTASSAVPPAQEETGEKCERCSKPMIIRWGRRGRFIACSGFPECRNSRSLDGEAQEDASTDETCDKCGGTMVLRNGRFGRFLACGRYPECSGRKSVMIKTGVACPQCGGDIVERRTRKGGRRFYGCNRYPECKFITRTEPLKSPCPACGGMLLKSASNRQSDSAADPNTSSCSRCNWTGDVPEPVSVGAANE